MSTTSQEESNSVADSSVHPTSQQMPDTESSSTQLLSGKDQCQKEVEDRPANSPRPNLNSNTTPRVPTDITFHSPSQIVGTPFSTSESVRFEYPFPDMSTSPGPSSTSPNEAQYTPGRSSLSATSPSSTSSIFRTISPRDNFQLPRSFTRHIRPKMHTTAPTTPPPPVPPGLATKLRRWSLGLLRRGSSNSVTGDSPPSPIPDGPSSPTASTLAPTSAANARERPSATSAPVTPA